MKSLVIAEKPSVARDIARVLHCIQKGNGILEGKEYVVTWALGHLVTLADPEEYDKKYMKWSFWAMVCRRTIPLLRKILMNEGIKNGSLYQNLELNSYFCIRRVL